MAASVSHGRRRKHGQLQQEVMEIVRSIGPAEGWRSATDAYPTLESALKVDRSRLYGFSDMILKALIAGSNGSGSASPDNGHTESKVIALPGPVVGGELSIPVETELASARKEVVKLGLQLKVFKGLLRESNDRNKRLQEEYIKVTDDLMSRLLELS